MAAFDGVVSSVRLCTQSYIDRITTMITNRLYSHSKISQTIPDIDASQRGEHGEPGSLG